MEWVQRKHNIEQVGRFVSHTSEVCLPNPLVMRAGIMQSKPSYKISRCIFNNEFIFCLVTQGRGWLTTQGVKTNLSVGDMFCIFPGVATEYGTHPHHLMHKNWVGFTGAQAAQLIAELGFSPGSPVFSLGTAIQTVIPYITEIRYELISAKPGFTWRATGHLWQFLGYLHTLVLTPTTDNPPTAELIHQAARYIEAHFADIGGVADIAKYIELSRSHFSRLFKLEMGLSPLDYLTEVRLTQAERLLAQTSHPIKNIAMSVGISDRAYFSRLFTQKRGVSPQKYRDTQQGIDHPTP